MDPLEGLSPVEALILRRELAAQPVDDATRAKNLKTTGMDALSVIPGPAQVLSAKDAVDSSGAAWSAFSGGDIKGGLGNTALAALGVLGVVTGSPFSRTAKQTASGASGRLNTFVGPESKTADKAALQQAEALKEAGADRDTIWKATGWGWDERGLPFYEIDDSAAALAAPKVVNGAPVKPQTFRDFLSHPDLDAALPSIGDHRFSEAGRPGSGGYFAGMPGQIDVGPGTAGARVRVALHEGQHAADDSRHASSGANSRVPMSDDAEEAARRLRGFFGAPFQRVETLQQQLDDLVMESTRGQSNFAVMTPAMQEVRQQLLAATNDLQAAARAKGTTHDPRIYAYWHNPGEVRARNVEGRRSLSALERRESPPWETIDVDEADILSGRGATGAPSQVLVPAMDSPRTSKALEMRSEGLDMPHIWRETQRAISPAGVAQREIPDQGMKFREGLKAGDNMTVGEAVEHPRLFEAFPSLRDRPMQVTNATDETGNAVRRTTPEGGFMVNPEGGDDMRGPMAKLFQYEINKATGGPAPLRHGTAALEKGLDNATMRADLLDPQNPKSRAAIDRYLDSLRGVKDEYEMLREASGQINGRSGFSGVSSATKRLGERNAGNVEGMIARRRATLPPEAMEAWPYRRNPPSGMKGQLLPKFESMFVLPPEGMKGRDLRAFIEAWEEFGAGRK